ncbi:MAG TPA: glycoside hydrolase family 9 protein, partial [Acidobacteriota bacterium]|nr:glycoside hydrolase family 9 protein [Acidobacteriota bacterium]
GIAAYQRLTHYGDNFAHRDELAWAACELFLATGDAEFQRELFRWLPDPTSDRTRRWGWWRLSESFGNAIRSYAFAARSGRLPQDKLDARYLRLCEGELLAAADDVLANTNASAYGTAFPVEAKRYRNAGWYFSLDTAMDLAAGWTLEHRDDYLAALTHNLVFETGVNPLNRSFITGIGRLRQREIVSQYAHNDRRALPPSGIPLGNIQSGLPYHGPTQTLLRTLSFPDDGDARDPFAYMDRWSDTHNVSTEFVVTNQARGLVSAAFLAARTSAAKRPWRAAEARIVLSNPTPQSGHAVTARLELADANPQLNLADADLIWEARGTEPTRAREFTLTPRRGGAHWIEAEASWPDGRRVFAAAEFRVVADSTAWIDDALPEGANEQAGGEAWNWIGASPAPFSGAKAHASASGNGVHEHGFVDASEALEVQSGDVLFVHVWLDPQNSPRELMVSWNDGSWEHRAYWGANMITYGTDGTAGRRAMGALPAAGRWVRVEVPARSVGLEGRSVRG